MTDTTHGNGNGTASNALAIREPAMIAAQRDRLAFEPGTWEQAIKVAAQLYQSGLLPRNIASPHAALALIVYGRERGLTTMQSLTGIYVVEGRPAMSAETMQALILARGACDYFRCVESTAERAVWVTKRKDSPEPVQHSFTIDDAKAAGLTGKDNWRKYPKAMLRARCRSELARMEYPDVVGGLYTPDEIEDPVNAGPVYDPPPPPPRLPVGPGPATRTEAVKERLRATIDVTPAPAADPPAADPGIERLARAARESEAKRDSGGNGDDHPTIDEARAAVAEIEAELSALLGEQRAKGVLSVLTFRGKTTGRLRQAVVDQARAILDGARAKAPPVTGGRAAVAEARVQYEDEPPSDVGLPFRDEPGSDG